MFTFGSLPGPVSSSLDKAFSRVEHSGKNTGKHTGKRKRQEPYYNDGRSPDKGSQLVPKTKRSRPSGGRGRQRGPRVQDLIDLTKAIPFQFRNDGTEYVNTCPLDCVLMSLYLLRKLGIVNASLLETDRDLHSVLNMIENAEYTNARLTWFRKVLSSVSDTSLPLAVESDIYHASDEGDTVDLYGDTVNHSRTQLSPCKIKSTKRETKCY